MRSSKFQVPNSKFLMGATLELGTWNLELGTSPLLVAIVGGSGSGKTWFAKKLQAALGRQATRLSLDDFYRDRSRLSPARRARLNFDHPRAIDWPGVERALHDLLAGRPARIPNYDFKTHCRRDHEKLLPPKPVVLMDGLWLLHRRSLRRLFALRIFIDCPARTRLRRRLARDRRSRGRTAAAVREQFCETVDPMHARFVAPQQSRADVVLPANFGEREVRELAKIFRAKGPHAKAAKTAKAGHKITLRPLRPLREAFREPELRGHPDVLRYDLETRTLDETSG